jgi:uncharacterized membrane protein YadS
MYQQQFDTPVALNAATVTKLVRNVCMAGVIPLVGALYHRSGDPSKRGQMRLAQAVPLFVFGFLAVVAFRTVGDLAIGPPEEHPDWKQFLERADAVAAWCLTIAMASVGLGTGLARVKRLGWKSFGVGLAAAVVVGGVSAGLITLLAGYLIG